MINQYFGFTRKLFSRNIDRKDAYLWKEYEELSLRLDFFLKEGGIFLLTGLIGSGKTTALRHFADSLDHNIHKTHYINSTFDRKGDFYRTLLMQCGVKPARGAGDSRNMLRRHILDMYYAKKITTVFIFDEAQNLPAFILEEIRLLSNFDYDSSSPVHIILSGHQLLQQRIAMHENEALRQRFTIKFHLTGLNLEDTCAYIRHWLTIAGSSGAIFSDSVLAKIHENSAGIPRIINNICKALLLAAAVNQQKIIDEQLFNNTQNEWQ